MCLWCNQLTLPYVLVICLQLASGVHFLHSCDVLHRDLKTDNALVSALTPTLVVKWADFGCSVPLTVATPSPYGLQKGKATPRRKRFHV